MIERLVKRDVTPAFTDHDPKLTLVVELASEFRRRADQWLSVSDQRGCGAHEDVGVFGRGLEPGLLDMPFEVEGQRPASMRVRDNWIERDVVEAFRSAPAVSSVAQAIERVRHLQDAA